MVCHSGAESAFDDFGGAMGPGTFAPLTSPYLL